MLKIIHLQYRRAECTDILPCHINQTNIDFLVWEDVCEKGSGKSKKTKVMPAGSTIRRIEGHAYLMQDEKWVRDRKPRVIENAHPHFHYTYGFGEKGLDVSEQYGVTIGYSDIHDVPAGFHLRDLRTGADVELI